MSIELHEFVPYPLTRDDKPDHVCNGGCACLECKHTKGARAAHYQNRDSRRPKEGVHHGETPAAPAGKQEREVLEGGKS